ncbi:MAG: 16S rRNA (cytidine(1402)-2'-O)-methyltransferase [Chloroflexi bacterium]|nr:16S rRNA (cytidine(1402)-2'-O)-methyltransferase [Chloroflexota bacterium]
MKPGTLFIVSTPIGNSKDITLRALEILEKADAVICEEFREASTLLKILGITEKQLLQLNEHNEVEAAEEMVMHLINGQTLALISDAGTPAFADPGTTLIKRCMELQVPVEAIPGPSSLMAAISLSPMPLDEFYFAGFLPRKEDQRKNKLNSLKRMNSSIILMDTPYRLKKLLEEVKEFFGTGRLVTVAIDLTQPDESVIHGTVNEVLQKVGSRKGEFILILHPSR